MANGMLVSGTLISELTYLQQLADHLQHTRDAVAEPASGTHDLAAVVRDQICGFQPDGVLPSDYVHLKQVTIARGTGDVTHAAMWRGAVVDIMGWSVG
jgi:hypothetical protein